MAASVSYDVVIVGGSFGGVAAALAAARDGGLRVAMIEATAWIGGQATSQGVTRWDENEFDRLLTETTGSNKSYRDLRDLIREKYNGARSQLGLEEAFFNPGFAGVGPPFTKPDGTYGLHCFAADPQIVREIFTELLRSAGVTVTFGAKVTAVDARGGSIHGITVASSSGVETLLAKVYLDATDLGDLLPLCGVKWVIGAESKADTGEQAAEESVHPEWIAPITVPIALELRPENEDHSIPKPANYDYIRAHQGFRIVDGDINATFKGFADGDTLWNYRQFIDSRNFSDDRPSRTTINVGSNDYLARAIPSGAPYSTEDEVIANEARAVSIAYLYYLQNDAPRDDGKGTGYKNLMADSTTFGTSDGTAPAPYIRESRRLANPYVRVVQSDIDTATKGTRARLFPDSCAIGQYAADIHRGWYSAFRDRQNRPIKSKAETPNIGTDFKHIGTLPFQVPLGSLLPKELNNLVAACKNIGATHITSGAYRVHPIEWSIGEAAGVLAAFSVREGVAPADVWRDARRLAAFQARLLAQGAPIFWWSDVRYEDDPRAFAAIHLLGVRGVFTGDGQGLAFQPKGDFPQSERNDVDRRLNHTFHWPQGPMTRAEAAVLICEELGLIANAG